VGPDLYYSQFLSKENGKDLMYMRLARNDCIVNKKMIDGTQCTVLWHVDDLKISHIKQEILARRVGGHS
jgi:hypothetical protein